MSQLLFLKTLGEEYLVKCVKTVEKYLDSHRNVKLSVVIADDGLLVYDNQVLLLNIRVAL